MKIINKHVRSAILHSDWWMFNRTIDLAFLMDSETKSRLVNLLPQFFLLHPISFQLLRLTSPLCSTKPANNICICQLWLAVSARIAHRKIKKSRKSLCLLVEREQPNLERFRRSAFLVFIIKPLQVKMPASCNFLRSPALIPCAITVQQNRTRLSVTGLGMVVDHDTRLGFKRK